jgi:hypothetical protein
VSLLKAKITKVYGHKVFGLALAVSSVIKENSNYYLFQNGSNFITGFFLNHEQKH